MFLHIISQIALKQEVDNAADLAGFSRLLSVFVRCVMPYQPTARQHGHDADDDHVHAARRRPAVS